MRGKTIAEAWRELAGDRPWSICPAWPPDVFAFTSVLLADSGAYRLVVSPHGSELEHAWPPVFEASNADELDDVPRARQHGERDEDPLAVRRRRWGLHLEQAARSWRDWAEASERRRSSGGGARPAELAELDATRPSGGEEHRTPDASKGSPADEDPSERWGPGERVEQLCLALEQSFERRVAELAQPEAWPLCRALLELHALADLASAGFGIPGSVEEPGIGLRARQLLLWQRSLATLERERIRVLPKLRTPQTGLTIRSLSHNLAIDRSEVDVRWQTSTMLLPGERAHELSLLVVPWPYQVVDADFRAAAITDPVVDAQAFGFFEYEPRQRFDPGRDLLPLLDAAEREGGGIAAVVLPESSLSEAEASEVEAALEGRVGFMLAGVRGERRNYAFLSVRHPSHCARYRQDKHHRWRIDAPQIRQYGLQQTLDPTRMWWEPMHVRPRALNFVCANPWLCMVPLICEDLARPDPVADVIRSVGPNLVVALLMDGPQLAARWPGRYASALADDPGSSILTLTSLGMALRSAPPGCSPKRTIALWKDPADGAREIELASDAKAVVLTLAAEFVEEYTADGRSNRGAAVRLVLADCKQVRGA